MSRRRFNDKDRARIFAANGGDCHLCGGKLDGGREPWEIEPVIAWELTRDDSDKNLRPAHISCHKTKTHEQDRPAINVVSDQVGAPTYAADLAKCMMQIIANCQLSIPSFP